MVAVGKVTRPSLYQILPVLSLVSKWSPLNWIPVAKRRGMTGDLEVPRSTVVRTPEFT